MKVFLLSHPQWHAYSKSSTHTASGTLSRGGRSASSGPCLHRAESKPRLTHCPAVAGWGWKLFFLLVPDKKTGGAEGNRMPASFASHPLFLPCRCHVEIEAQLFNWSELRWDRAGSRVLTSPASSHSAQSHHDSVEVDVHFPPVPLCHHGWGPSQMLTFNLRASTPTRLLPLPALTLEQEETEATKKILGEERAEILASPRCFASEGEPCHKTGLKSCASRDRGQFSLMIGNVKLGQKRPRYCQLAESSKN